MKPAITIITDTTVVQPDGELRKATVIIKGKKIKELTDEAPGYLLLSHENVSVVDGSNCFLTPGLIDQHINGALGCDFNQCEVHQAQRATRELPKHGITGILPTIITAPLMDMMTSINAMDQLAHSWRSGHTRIFGLHLEGPLISKKYRGTHPESAIPDTLDPSELQCLISPKVKIVTIAPEKDPQGLITKFLTDQGVRVSAGHSNATTEDMTRCVAQGLCGVTHIFNACKPFHHRDPGVIGSALANNSLFVEIIGDGIHVHPNGVKAVLNAKDMKHSILVSDAMHLAGRPNGSSASFAGTTVTLKDGQALNTEGNLAGGAQLLDECVRNLVKWGTLPFSQAVQLACQTPANFLGLGDTYGQVVPGYQADLVLWNKESLAIESTWIDGEQVFQKDKGTHEQPSSSAA